MFVTHINELVYRVLYVVIAWALGFVVSYEYSVELVERRSSSAMTQLNQGFLLTSPLEILSAMLNLSVWFARFRSAPILYAQTLLFILPGLYGSEVKSFVVFRGFRVGLWLSSAYLRLWILPFLWDFLFGLLPTGNDLLNFDLHLRLSEYLTTIKSIFKLINLVIYFPALLFIFFRMGYLPVDWFMKSRRISVLICLMFSAFMTPPDILSQLIIAGTLIVLMEIRRLVLLFRIRYKYVTDGKI
jgi:sec-independent protein translocase protein TatC